MNELIVGAYIRTVKGELRAEKRARNEANAPGSHV
jgi:hypothetical protein